MSESFSNAPFVFIADVGSFKTPQIEVKKITRYIMLNIFTLIGQQLSIWGH